MPISTDELKRCIDFAGFPVGKRLQVIELIENGLTGYRAYKKQAYYSHTGKIIKKPTPAHEPNQGRPDQEGARTILISALCRAWWVGFEKEPTLNNKNDPDSPFFNFAMQILAREGIGNIHPHLEAYWSRRKEAWLKNDPT